MLWPAAQQGDRHPELSQQQQRALQPGATVGMRQQRFVLSHALAGPTAEQAAAQGWHPWFGSGCHREVPGGLIQWLPRDLLR